MSLLGNLGLFLHSVHSHTSCDSIVFYLCESFWICRFVCFRPTHFQLQKSESDATSASALKISCPRSSFRWCGAERFRPEAMPSEAGIRVSWVRIYLGMIFSIFSFTDDVPMYGLFSNLGTLSFPTQSHFVLFVFFQPNHLTLGNETRLARKYRI